jgi:hypothetical protein
MGARPARVELRIDQVGPGRKPDPQGRAGAAWRHSEAQMGKYDPLGAHMRRQRAQIYEMSFRDIERVLGALLPKGAQRAEWWSNPSGAGVSTVQSKAWRDVGYEAELLKAEERVRFTRVAPRTIVKRL